ncbi:hypothetical protein [Bradyrhizobium sp.]|uniref:hypothetical protein n=1 Tax=Bradyrhizobium sp. TaxID=376 RepID=UPI003BB08C14
MRIGSQSPSSTKPDPCDGDRAKAEVSQKKKRRQAPREEFVAYVVAIECWDWSFTLLGNDDKRPVDPYHEFRHLQITGRLLRPIGLKTDRVELALLPTNDMSEAKRKGYEPIALGRWTPCPASSEARSGSRRTFCRRSCRC